MCGNERENRQENEKNPRFDKGRDGSADVKGSIYTFQMLILVRQASSFVMFYLARPLVTCDGSYSETLCQVVKPQCATFVYLSGATTSRKYPCEANTRIHSTAYSNTM